MTRGEIRKQDYLELIRPSTSFLLRLIVFYLLTPAETKLFVWEEDHRRTRSMYDNTGTLLPPVLCSQAQARKDGIQRTLSAGDDEGV